MDFSSTRVLRRVVIFGCACALLVLANPVHADDPPTFSNPEVTAFVKEYNTFMEQLYATETDYVAATLAKDQARVDADDKKLQEYSAKIPALNDRRDAFESRLKPDETKKFADFVASWVVKLYEAVHNPPGAPASTPGAQP